MAKIKEVDQESSSDSEAEKVLEELENSDSEPENVRNENSDDDAGSDFDFNEEDVEMLAKTDPEFHAWLKKTQPGLLETVQEEESDSENEDEKQAEMEAFGKTESFDEDLEDETDQADASFQKLDDPEDEGPKSIDEKFLEDLMKSLEKGGTKNHVRAFNKLVCVLVAAVDFVSQGDEAGKRAKETQIRDFMHSKMGRSGKDFFISEADIFNSSLMIALRHVSPCLDSVLGAENLKNSIKDSKFDITTVDNWKKVKTGLRVYIEIFSQLLKRLVDPESRILLLRHLYQITPILNAFPRSAKGLVLRLVKIWCHFPKKADTVKEAKSVSNKLRVLSYLIINKLITNRQTLAEFSARNMYQNFQSQIKTTSVHTLPVIDFMLRTLSELYLKDILLESGVSYKHCFLYVRNLALTLRKCITTQKHQEVMTWGFVHSLKLWNLVVAKSGDTLKELVFPISYICQGAIGMEGSLKNLPFRAQMNEILLFTVEQTGVFVPMHTEKFILELKIQKNSKAN